MTQTAEGPPRRRFTVAEVKSLWLPEWREDERLEMIGGELRPVSPKANHHGVLKTALLARWYSASQDDATPSPG